MINSFDDYQLSYTLFLAESEMYKNLMELGSTLALSESVDIQSIEEGVKDTVMNYLDKVIKGIQKAWEKFKSAFAGKVQSLLNKTVKPALDKAGNVQFTINNYTECDLKGLASVHIVPFDYSDATKSAYENESEFYKAKYPGLGIEGVNVKEALEKKYVKVVEKQPANKEFLTKLYDFCTKNYKEQSDAIGADIDGINNASKTITGQVSTVTTAQEAYTIWESAYLQFITEEENGKMSYEDSSGETTGDPKSDDAKAKSAMTKAVTVYMSASTKIISAKMGIINKYFKDSCMEVLNHLVDSVKNNITAVKAKEATPTTAPTVDTK